MNEREAAICDFFADWSSEIHRQFSENHDPARFKEPIKEIRDNAKDAYRKKQECWDDRSMNGYSEAEENFHEAAYQYFLHRLHLGDGLYESAIYRLDSFFHNWNSLEQIIAVSESIADVLERTIYQSTDFKMVDHVLANSTYEDNIEDFPKFKTDLAIKKEEEWESQFGKKAVFEEVGRFYASKHFSQMLRGRGRLKKSWGDNPDTFRAFQLTRLVNKMNSELESQGFVSTTITEVFEMLIGQSSILHKYARKDEIEWTLNEYYMVKNITVRGLLNSVSRGKQLLTEQDCRCI